MLASSARANDLPVTFFGNLIWQESRFDAGSISRAGAQGIAQFMPKTAAMVGLADPFDPLAALPASARLLRDLVRQFGNLGLAAAAYNAGPGRVLKWLAKVNELPRETRAYVRLITGRHAEEWRPEIAQDKAPRLTSGLPCRHMPAFSIPDDDDTDAPSPALARVANASPHAPVVSGGVAAWKLKRPVLALIAPLKRLHLIAQAQPRKSKGPALALIAPLKRLQLAEAQPSKSPGKAAKLRNLASRESPVASRQKPDTNKKNSTHRQASIKGSASNRGA
jgi:hypothetical protein